MKSHVDTSITQDAKNEEVHAPKNSLPQTTYKNSAIAAAGSGLFGAYASFFFEGMKKRTQTDQIKPKIKDIGTIKWTREAFRGSAGFAASLIPTCVLQQMTYLYLNDKNLANTSAGKAVTTLVSGGIGGIASTMVENVILKQQVDKIGPIEAIRRLNQDGRTRILKGLPLIVGRESVFGFCYLDCTKKIGEYVKYNYGSAYILPAKIAVGAIGSLITHPLDTTASTMQKYQYNKISDAAKHLYAENGIKSFYKGGAWRVGLFTTSMLAIDESSKVLKNLLTDKNESPKFK